MQAASETLLDLGNYGLQLTPGNAPTPGFETWLASHAIPIRSHHGFDYHKLRHTVWDETGNCLVHSDSVHPPKYTHPTSHFWFDKLEKQHYQNIIFETMYPEYLLGNGDDLNRAMQLKTPLAVDISHIYIQLEQGSLEKSIWNKLQNYEYIKEIHLSANQGCIDNHQPLQSNSFGLAWAKEHLSSLPVILECYMFKLSKEQCLSQIDVIIH